MYSGVENEWDCLNISRLWGAGYYWETNGETVVNELLLRMRSSTGKKGRKLGEEISTGKMGEGLRFP